MGVTGVKAPVVRLMEYCETLVALVLATNSQLSSLRMAIEFAPKPAGFSPPVNAVKAPVNELITYPEMLFDPVFTTYKNLPYASTAIGPGLLLLVEKGEVVTGWRLKSAIGQGGCDRTLMALQIV